LLSLNSETLASTGQQSLIQQALHGEATATSDQNAGIDQGTGN
jgi:hypothetical protein